MAVLPAGDRASLRRDFASELSGSRTPCSTSKPDLQAAVDAVDGWLDANAASLNAAIPVAARTTLTVKQKAQLLVYVIRRRFEVA